MSAISPYQLSNAILNGLEQSGASSTLLSRPTKQPREIAIYCSGGEYHVRAYGWTITGGGRGRNVKDEYRVQITKRMEPSQKGHTVLLGYDPASGMFGGFDFARHEHGAHSASIQMKGATFERARQQGMALHRKSSGECAFAIRPDRLLDYILRAHAFHGSRATITASEAPKFDSDEISVTYGQLAQVQLELDDMLSRPFEPFNNDNRSVHNNKKKARAQGFYRNVRRMDDGRCVVCGRGLKFPGKSGIRYEVQAAHIIAVEEDGTDDFRNGITLCGAHHKLFDERFWTISDDLTIIIPPNLRIDLQNHPSRTDILEYEGKPIRCSRDKRYRPAIEAIRHHRGKTMEADRDGQLVVLF